ncbi:MAG: PucR family transcriptional regulator [Coriobacteriaceae bacterium]|nr:PucR family transcriptional regulator [Coriobacteriaceae bacterium]
MFSMWMLHDELAGSIVHSSLGRASKARCLKGALPCLDINETSFEYVYVIDAQAGENIQIPSTYAYLVIVGDHFRCDEQSDCQYIVLNGEIGYTEALVLVLKAFARFNEWYMALQRELNDKQDLNRICKIGNILLANPLYIFSSDHSIIAGFSPGYDVLINDFCEKIGPYYIPTPELMNTLTSEQQFQQTFKAYEATLYHSDVIGFDIMYVNLGSSERFEGRLTVSSLVRPFEEGDFQIAEIITEVVRIAWRRSSLRYDELSQVFRVFLASVLEGDAAESKQTRDSLRLWRWERLGRFVCIYVMLSEQDLKTSTDAFICSSLELALPRSCALRFRNCIACVAPLTDDWSKEDILDTLRDNLEELVSHIGISSTFEDILEADQYFNEAAEAVVIGVEQDPMRWDYPFQEYAILHYHRFGTSRLSAVHYCDDDVRRLLAYRGKSIDYYQTLKIYLEHNMNLLQTSEALYIHRTTLFKRLTKIRSMIEADLDDARQRKRMQFSFMLLENSEHFSVE